jgi:hypothetical protein
MQHRSVFVSPRSRGRKTSVKASDCQELRLHLGADCSLIKLV